MTPAARRTLFGVAVDSLTMDEAIAAIARLVERRRPSLIVTPNAQHIVLLQEPGDFRSAYRSAALVLADSVPLVRVSRLLGVPLKKRVAGADVMPALCRVAAEKRYRVFLLGAAPGVAGKAAAIFAAEHPGLAIAGIIARHGSSRPTPERRRLRSAPSAPRPPVLPASGTGAAGAGLADHFPRPARHHRPLAGPRPQPPLLRPAAPPRRILHPELVPLAGYRHPDEDAARRGAAGRGFLMSGAAGRER